MFAGAAVEDEVLLSMLDVVAESRNPRQQFDVIDLLANPLLCVQGVVGRKADGWRGYLRGRPRVSGVG